MAYFCSSLCFVIGIVGVIFISVLIFLVQSGNEYLYSLENKSDKLQSLVLALLVIALYSTVLHSCSL
jgi:hypothetical protein